MIFIPILLCIASLALCCYLTWDTHRHEKGL